MPKFTPFIREAQAFATKAHKGQKRRYTGKPYIGHPARVATMAFEYGLSDDAIAAAWLHDVVEDCGVTLKELDETFGSRVAELVLSLSDLQTPKDGNRAKRKADYATKIHLTQDSDAHTVKVLDLIDNAPSIRDHDPKFWEVYKQEVRYLLGYLNKADEDAKKVLREILEGS